MSRKYVLFPVLVTLAVLVISLFPTANVTQRASAAPRVTVVAKYLMIPPAAFSASSDNIDYFNSGSNLEINSGNGSFVAPVYLPPGANIRLIKLFAYDVNVINNLCAFLYESNPKTGGKTKLKEVCTTGSGGIQKLMKGLYHTVRWYHGYYILLDYQSIDMSTIAVMLKYTVNQ
jgi:hypothetical protein